MKKLLRNKRKGYAHFSYMKSLQRPFPDPNKLIMAFPYIGPFTMQSKAAKRLRKNRAKPWKYLRIRKPITKPVVVTLREFGCTDYFETMAERIRPRMSELVAEWIKGIKTHNQAGVEDHSETMSVMFHDRNKVIYEFMKKSAADFFNEWSTIRIRSPFIYSHSSNTKPKENP